MSIGTQRLTGHCACAVVVGLNTNIGSIIGVVGPQVAAPLTASAFPLGAAVEPLLEGVSSAKLGQARADSSAL